MFLLFICNIVYSKDVLSKNDIKFILLQVMNVKELNIGVFREYNGKIARFPVLFNSSFIVKDQLHNVKKYNLKDFFINSSDVIFYTNKKELYNILLKNKDLMNFVQHADIREVPIFAIEEIKFFNNTKLVVRLINDAQYVFSFEFSKTFNSWKLKRLSMRYKFSDTCEEYVVLY